MSPDEIKSLRDKLGLSIRAFAKIIGVAHTTVVRWENGENTPKGTASQALKQVLEQSSGRRRYKIPFKYQVFVWTSRDFETSKFFPCITISSGDKKKIDGTWYLDKNEFDSAKEAIECGRKLLDKLVVEKIGKKAKYESTIHEDIFSEVYLELPLENLALAAEAMRLEQARKSSRS